MKFHLLKVAVWMTSLTVLACGKVTMIAAYPSTRPIPLGTAVVLECGAAGESSTYRWRCPNGACDISSESRVTPRSRIVNSNTLTVNVVSESDGGEYRCTVNEGGNTQTRSYNLTVSGGIILYKQESRTPLAVYPSGSVVTSESQVSSGFYHVAVKCVGGNSAQGTWSSPDGSDISTSSFAHVQQDRGELLVSNLETGFSNGNYKCRVGGSEAVIGLYLTSGSHVGTYSRSITNFQANQTSSSTVRLLWDELTRPNTVTTVGYFVSYGRVDHGVKENMIVEGRSTTSVDLSNLHTGVEYEATIRGFSEDGTVRRVSTPVVTVKWTMEDDTVVTDHELSTSPLVPLFSLSTSVQVSAASVTVKPTKSYTTVTASSPPPAQATATSIPTVINPPITSSKSTPEPATTSSLSPMLTSRSTPGPITTTVTIQTANSTPTTIIVTLTTTSTPTINSTPTTASTLTTTSPTTASTLTTSSILTTTSTPTNSSSSTSSFTPTRSTPTKTTIAAPASTTTSTPTTSSSSTSSFTPTKSTSPKATGGRAVTSASTTTDATNTSPGPTLASGSPDERSSELVVIIGATIGGIVAVLLIIAIIITIIVLAFICSVKKSTQRQKLQNSNGSKYWDTQDTKL